MVNAKIGECKGEKEGDSRNMTFWDTYFAILLGTFPFLVAVVLIGRDILEKLDELLESVGRNDSD